MAEPDSGGRQSIPLLRTRLYIPPPRREWVSRPRLLKRLEEGLGLGSDGFARKITLISAPAGFGKTTLLSQCIAKCELVAAWVSLDEGDNDPFRFWTYITAALAALEPLPDGLSAESWPVVPSPPDDAFLTELVNIMSGIRQPVTLVLDDLHLIEDASVHHGLVFLLDNLPPYFHLILAGRADPPWPMARLRARGELTELRAPALRFTPDEAATWLNQAAGLALSGDDISALDRRIEGWAAGLQMAAISLQGHREAQGEQGVARFIRTFTGSHRFVLDYLMEEVINQQSPATQEFLLKTSVLERMCAGLCDAVLGTLTDAVAQPSLLLSPSQALLEHLEAANLFLIPLDDERRWYRYHNLFADLLRSRFEQQVGSEGLRSVHAQASRWYEDNGLVAEAVRHAIESDDFDRVARLVEENALQLIYYVELQPVMRWLDTQPPDVMQSRPWLGLGHAWALLYAGRFEPLEMRLQDVEASLEPDSGAERTQAEEQQIKGHIAAIRSYATWLRGEAGQTAQLAKEAMALLPAKDTQARSFAVGTLGGALQYGGDLTGALEAYGEAFSLSQAADNRYLMVIMLCQMANVHRLAGRLEQAAEYCRSALQLTDEHARQTGQQLPVAGYARSHLSQILYEWNLLDSALDHAQEGLALCNLWGQKTIAPFCNHRLARVLFARGETEAALKHARLATETASAMSMWNHYNLRAWEARVQLDRGNLKAAADWAKSVPLKTAGKLDPRFLGVYSVLAQVWASEGRFDEALDLLERTLTGEETGDRIDNVTGLLVLQAEVLQKQGEADKALRVLSHALSLAAPEGYVRTFLDRGEALGDLLQAAAASGVQPDYTGRLLKAWRQESQSSQSGQPEPVTAPSQSLLIDPLSERELEVLKYLGTSLTVPEIADQLYVAVSTVRSHTKNIYSKLDVHSRMEALRRAEDLQLL